MEIKFPVILYDETSMCYAFKDQRTFETTNEDGYRKGVFNNMTLFDSAGNIHDIYGAEIVGWAAPLWGYLTLRKGRQVRVKLKYTARQEKLPPAKNERNTSE